MALKTCLSYICNDGDQFQMEIRKTSSRRLRSIDDAELGHFTLGSLSTRVFETRTATGREHFAGSDGIVSQIFIILISNGEKILSNVNVVI